MQAISRAAVIGAGSMGGGIAAQFANAGVPVLLLDRPTEGSDRSAIARAGLARQRDPVGGQGGFMHPDRAGLVTPGNTEDDLRALAGADWIVEAIIEDAAAKQSLYAAIAAVRAPGSLLSSNTSTIPLSVLTHGMADALAADTVITHFFNPPRPMRLVELVTGPRTGAPAAARARAGADQLLGKTVVDCRDTPGFIANRLGMFWMSLACLEAIRLGLTVEEADAVAGPPFGIPRTGVFGLFDLVGIDLAGSAWGSLLGALEADDAHQRLAVATHPIFAALVASGSWGRKSGAGFYRRQGRTREALDLATMQFRPEAAPPDLPRDLTALLDRGDRLGAYAWSVLAGVVGYAAAVAPEIAGDVAAIDTAMQLGYNWRWGPFALADRVGPARIAARLGSAAPPLLAAAAVGGFHRPVEIRATTGAWLPRPRPEGVLALAAVKAAGPRVLGNDVVSLWDLGDGAACLELHGKLGVFDHRVFDVIEHTMAAMPGGFGALVIASDDPRAFSAGANLAAVRTLIAAGEIDALITLIARGQAAMRDLRHAPFPVVAAAAGLALGGGCEALLHCDAVVAHAELAAGLPEAKVGLVPAWGGCTRLLSRGLGAAHVFALVATAQVSGSALLARGMGVLTSEDAIVMNRDRVLAAAKARALALVAGYAAPPPAPVRLHPFAAPHDEAAAPHDRVVAETLAGVLAGEGEVGEDALYGRERDAIAALARYPATLARIDHMLATGKPLRN